ncbi:MAG: DUF2061 domain-containing protein [Sandaracinaceae bacterium]|nr:DUF2061 domain-containing protein [Sandaracinaceae bacterium]
MIESHQRSVVKGISWRVVGTIDTVIVAFLVTGQGMTALHVGLSEVLTKIVLYYAHERLWVFLRREQTRTTRVAILKAITWRATGTVDTMLLGWLYTGSLWSGVKIGAFEVVTKLFLYYVHERVWARVPIGTVRNWLRFRRAKRDV